jgi:hypothetical protein
VSSDADTIRIGYHVVLLIDVLNQRDAIRAMEKLPSTDEQRQQYIAAVKNSAGVVDGVRQMVEGFFRSFLSAPAGHPVEQLPPQQRKLYENSRECRVEAQMFSDTVIVYAPLVTQSGGIGIRGVYALMAAACSMMLTTLAAKTSIRGGLDVGVAMELRPRDLYGPALAETYRLESTVAQYPRVAVGRGLVDFLTSTIQSDTGDALSSLNAEMARVCLELLAKDTDGVPFLDYLGSGMRTLLGGSGDRDLAEKALAFAQAEHQRFCDQGNSKLALRYALLRQYIEARLDDWRERPNE